MTIPIIKVGAPTVEFDERTGNAVLMADVDDCGIAKHLEMRVSQEYGCYLVHERSDAFVLMLLYYAMELGSDIVCEAPMSEQLHFQLTRYYIPLVARYVEPYRSIAVHARLTSEQLPCEGKVVAGVSGGIDSSFTIQTYRRSEWGVSSLTHVLFHNLIGDPLSSSSSDAASTCEELKVAAQRYADRAGLPLVTVESNFQFDFIHKHSMPAWIGKWTSAFYALGKLFGTYLLSSAHAANVFDLRYDDGMDTSAYDLLSCYLFSTDGHRLYLAGMEATRVEKLSAILDDEGSTEKLLVCNLFPDRNCGACEKCLRTLNAAYALDALDSMGGGFDIKAYRRHLGRNLGFTLWKARCADEFHLEIREELQKRDMRIPASAFLYGWIWHPLVDRATRMLRNNRIARKIYYSFDGDVRRFGGETAQRRVFEQSDGGSDDALGKNALL